MHCGVSGPQTPVWQAGRIGELHERGSQQEKEIPDGAHRNGHSAGGGIDFDAVRFFIIETSARVFLSAACFGKRLEGAFENAVQGGDGQSVIADRHILPAALFDARKHGATIKGAGAAMNDE